MSDIKIFANAANVASTNAATDSTAGGTKLSISSYDSAKGIVINDDSADNRDEFDTGFIAKTPSSSVTLNTILRQCSTMAKILADVCEQTTGVAIVPTSAPDNNANAVAGKLTELLNKLNGLITGASAAPKATEASNYIEGGTIHHKAKEHSDEIQKILSGRTVVKAAMYAEGDTTNSIHSRLTKLNSTIENKIVSSALTVTPRWGSLDAKTSVIKSGNLVLIRYFQLNTNTTITGSSNYQTIATIRNVSVSSSDASDTPATRGQPLRCYVYGLFSNNINTQNCDLQFVNNGNDVCIQAKIPLSGTLTQVSFSNIGFELLNSVI